MPRSKIEVTISRPPVSEQLTEYARSRGALYHKLQDLGVLYRAFVEYIHEIVRLRMPLRCLYDIFMQPPALAGAGCPEIKLK